jgi:hypothetical protein
MAAVSAPLDLLEIATLRYAAARSAVENVSCAQASPEAQVALELARADKMAAYMDVVYVRGLIAELGELWSARWLLP